MKRSTVASGAVTAILLIALFLGLRIWASGRAVAITGPSGIKQGADGSVYILSNDILYVHDRDGGLIDRIPMSRFGTDHVTGDFWVYRNGDLLLRRDVPRTLTLTGEAELLARTGAGEKDRLGNGESILQRCSITTFQCAVFGGGGDVFDKLTAFRLAVDEDRGTTYLSDAVGHQLLMLDERGKIVKRSTGPFHFPNGIVLDGAGLLYVADTNNHRLAAVTVDNERFGTVENEIAIVHPGNAFKPSWPMAMARASDGNWWVINADNNMSHGTVMILNGKGALQKTVSLPKGADPLHLMAAGDRVLIADPALMRVYNAGPTGELHDDFGSLSFKLDLAELRRERRLYETLAAVSMGALLVLFAAALALARQSRVQEADGSAGQADPLPAAGIPVRPAGGSRRYDYHNLLGLYRIKFAVLSVLVAAVLTFFFLISRGMTLFHREFFPAALLGHFVLVFFSYLHYKRSYIEIDEQGITYQGMVRSIRSPWNGVRTIRVFGSASKVATDHGNFSIGPMEPADNPPGGWLDHLRAKRIRFQKELIGEIHSRAPLAKLSMSRLARYQWKRLEPAQAGDAGAHKNGADGLLPESEAEELDKPWTAVRIIWGTLLGSLAAYLLFCKLAEDGLAPLSPGLPIGTVRMALFGTALATVVAASYIRKAMLKISAGDVRPRRRHEQHPAAAKYTSAIVVTMALSESIGICGVVLFVLSKDAPTLYLFILISALAMFYYRPRKAELLQVAVDMRESRGADGPVQ